MDTGNNRRKPWKSWTEFTGWAQDFSLRQKVLGGFLAVVVLVGLVTSLIGTRLARETIMDRARARLSSDVSTAGFILKNAQEILELKIRLIAGSDKIAHAMEIRDVKTVRNWLATAAMENDMDFLSIADEKGRMVASAFVENPNLGDVSSDAIITEALKARNAAGIAVVPLERLSSENPLLIQRLGKDADNTGMVIEAAQPLTDGAKLVGVLYGGILLNNNNLIPDRIALRLFSGEVYDSKPVGYVSIFQGDRVVSTTFKGKDGLPLIGSQSDSRIPADVLSRGLTSIMLQTRLGTPYLTAAEPIVDAQGKILGAIEVATQERPIIQVIDRLLATFLIIGLLGVILMAAITYFLVTWINRPLEQMLNAARRAAEGDLTQQVPVIARDEVGELAATFNLMIRNLAETRNRLEEWGKELASKVAEQTGEVNRAREQVARVKKLASLEKMADGMAHIMAHISDSGAVPGTEDSSGTSPRILVLDRDESVLDICERILGNEGFHVVLTRTVKETLDELQKEFFDVVVADVDMPEMSPQELLKEIKYRQPEVLVIMTAPFKSTEEAVETVKMGAFDYIPKPFGPHQILFMVYTALQARSMVEKTRKQLAERRAEVIFQRLPVAIALADAAHRVVYNNKAFEELANVQGQEAVQGRTFKDLFGVDPLEASKELGSSRWLQLEKVGRTAKLYNFKLVEEDLRVLMLLDITDTVKKDQQADVFKAETMAKAQQVIHQQMRVAQEIAGLLGETTAETKAALFELIKLAGEAGEAR